MADVKLKDYRGYIVSKLVDVDVSYNDAALDMSESEARSKKLWMNTAAMPTVSQINAKWNELKAEIQAEADLFSGEFDRPALEARAKSYCMQDPLLGMTAEKATEFLFVKQYGTVAQANQFLDDNSSLS